MPYVALINTSSTTCNVERQTAAADATGANAPTWTARLSNVKCVIQPMHRGREIADFDRDDSLVHYQVFTAIDIAATTQDRLSINGVYYPVVSYGSISSLMSTETVYTTIVSRRN